MAQASQLPPSNDFSFYDQMLDMAVLVDAVPARYRSGLRDATNQYFAMARGVQAEGVNLAALQLTKWFDTNYHYLVPVEGGLRLVGPKMVTRRRSSRGVCVPDAGRK